MVVVARHGTMEGRKNYINSMSGWEGHHGALAPLVLVCTSLCAGRPWNEIFHQRRSPTSCSQLNIFLDFVLVQKIFVQICIQLKSKHKSLKATVHMLMELFKTRLKLPHLQVTNPLIFIVVQMIL